MSDRRLVPATIYDLDAQKCAKERISMEELAQFRRQAFGGDLTRRYPGIDNLVLDKWDEISEHALCRKNGKIVGASRIVPASNGILPLSQNIADAGLSFKKGDSEMGRFIIEYQSRVGPPAVALFVACLEIYRTMPAKFSGDIFGDVISEGKFRLKRRSYYRMGFKELGLEYYDADYDAKCEIYKMPKLNREKFYQFIMSLSGNAHELA